MTRIFLHTHALCLHPHVGGRAYDLMCWGETSDSFAVFAVDIKNEPVDASWGIGDASTDWGLAAGRIGNHILKECPRILVVVEGVYTHTPEDEEGMLWGENLVGAPLEPECFLLSQRQVAATASPHLTFRYRSPHEISRLHRKQSVNILCHSQTQQNLCTRRIPVSALPGLAMHAIMAIRRTCAFCPRMQGGSLLIDTTSNLRILLRQMAPVCTRSLFIMLLISLETWMQSGSADLDTLQPIVSRRS